MCALAHLFEEESLATTVVALVREHAEKMRPPRALWVPFELGRPFGAPNNVEQQLDVLDKALALLQNNSTEPVLNDFIETDALQDVEKPWGFPVALQTESVLTEMQSIVPLWEQAQERHGRTTVGLSSLSPEEAIDFVRRYFSGDPLPNPKGMANVARARFAIDDIKALYTEAGAAVGSPASTQLQDWFWNKTIAGEMILDFQHRARSSDNKNLNMIAGSLVPAERVR